MLSAGGAKLVRAVAAGKNVAVMKTSQKKSVYAARGLAFAVVAGASLVTFPAMPSAQADEPRKERGEERRDAPPAERGREKGEERAREAAPRDGERRKEEARREGEGRPAAEPGKEREARREGEVRREGEPRFRVEVSAPRLECSPQGSRGIARSAGEAGRDGDLLVQADQPVCKGAENIFSCIAHSNILQQVFQTHARIFFQWPAIRFLRTLHTNSIDNYKMIFGKFC